MSQRTVWQWPEATTVWPPEARERERSFGLVAAEPATRDPGIDRERFATVDHFAGFFVVGLLLMFGAFVGLLWLGITLGTAIKEGLR